MCGINVVCERQRAIPSPGIFKWAGQVEVGQKPDDTHLEAKIMRERQEREVYEQRILEQMEQEQRAKEQEAKRRRQQWYDSERRRFKAEQLEFERQRKQIEEQGRRDFGWY